MFTGLGSSLVASGSVYTYYLYDTVYMIHDAIVQLIQKGTRINNGTALLNQLYNSQFVGVTGLTNIDSVCLFYIFYVLKFLNTNND